MKYKWKGIYSGRYNIDHGNRKITFNSTYYGSYF